MRATDGAAAAFFGVGMAPLLQLGLLTVHHLPLRQTVGTTMLVLPFISASGGAALARHGDVSMLHLLGLTIGLASGAYIGARFTRRAPRRLLRSAVITIPFVCCFSNWLRERLKSGGRACYLNLQPLASAHVSDSVRELFERVGV